MNNLKLILALVVLLFASSAATAQRKSKKKVKRNRAAKVEWILNYKDGSSATGNLKDFFSSQEKLKFDNATSRKKEKVKSEELESIVYRSGDKELLFERHLYKYFGLRKKIKGKDKIWAAKVAGNEKMEGYLIFTSQTSVGSHPTGGGVMHNSYVGQSLAIRVFPNNYIFHIGTLSVAEKDPLNSIPKAMNKRLKLYIENYCPEFASTIKKRTYEVDEIEKIIEDYSAMCH